MSPQLDWDMWILALLSLLAMIDEDVVILGMCTWSKFGRWGWGCW